MPPTNNKKIKVLYIDHAAAYPEEQKKFDYLAQQPELEIILVRPDKWSQVGRNENFASHHTNSAYKTVFAKATFNGFRHRSFFTNEIGRVFREFQPDIIHLFEEANTFFSLQAFLLRRLFSKNSKLIFDNFQNILFEHVGYKFYRLYDFIEKLVFNDAACATVRYSGSRDFLLKRKFTKPILELPWGTDIHLFSPQDGSQIRKKNKLDCFTMAYIGRLEEDKGILLLIEALAKVKHDFKLIVIGGGRAEPKMNELISKYSLESGVQHLGYVPHRELPEYYSAVDCVVVPTITTSGCKEQFGRVIVEAMACGTPVIGSTSGAIPSVIGETGLVFEDNNVDDLTEKITNMITSPELHQHYSEVVRKRVINNYSLDKFAQNCVSIYLNILATPHISVGNKTFEVSEHAK